MHTEEDPPDPGRIDVLRREIESDLERLRGSRDQTGPTLDMIASKLDELISVAKAFEARGRKVSPKIKLAVWHLGAQMTAELVKRIVSAAHNCKSCLKRQRHRRRIGWKRSLRLVVPFANSGALAVSSSVNSPGHWG